MENGKKEITIVAFGFLKISLEAFVNILHGAYTLFTFLKSLN